MRHSGISAVVAAVGANVRCFGSWDAPETDDAFPIIHTTGFLSVVIPNFALGPIGFEDAYLTEMQEDGRWHKVAIARRLILT